MDTGILIRVLFALAVAAALFVQARKLSGQPNRRRAFQLGAAAFVCFAVFNGSLGVTADFGALQQAVALAGMGLFVASAVSLVLSLRSGERAADAQRATAEAQAFREEREQKRGGE
jgi:hypothetical protein